MNQSTIAKAKPPGRGRTRPPFLPLALLAGTLAAAAPAHAADTVETWDVGASDVDFYVGVEGVGADAGSFADIMLGYGILEGFSAYLGTTLASDEHLADGSSETYLGIFGTLIDSAHFDLDGFLHVVAGGGDFQLAPAVELNFDADPEQRTWGTYLRSHLPVYGRHLARPGQPMETETDTTYHVALTGGFYRTLAARHQLLVEASIDLHPSAGESFGDRAFALGYNRQLTDSLELITQVQTTVPQAEGQVGFGVMAGFIATLPASRK